MIVQQHFIFKFTSLQLKDHHGYYEPNHRYVSFIVGVKTILCQVYDVPEWGLMKGTKACNAWDSTYGLSVF